MAGLERGDFPRADWSTTMTRSMCSMPSMDLWAPGVAFVLWNFLARARWRMLWMRVDFPEPEEPVTQTSWFRGMETVRLFRLFSFAPIIFKK